MNSRDFSRACGELASKACELNTPDLVIGILRGGDLVALQMVENGYFNNIPYATIGYQRPGTAIKKNPLISYALKLLPRMVLNILRRLESNIREYRYYKRGCKYYNGKKPVCDTETRSQILSASSILVVDDAIDSGITLSKAIGLIKEINPHAQCFIAVLTETFEMPLLKADVSLFKRVLIRFPWSEDFK